MSTLVPLPPLLFYSFYFQNVERWDYWFLIMCCHVRLQHPLLLHHYWHPSCWLLVSCKRDPLSCMGRELLYGRGMDLTAFEIQKSSSFLTNLLAKYCRMWWLCMNILKKMHNNWHFFMFVGHGNHSCQCDCNKKDCCSLQKLIIKKEVSSNRESQIK